MFSSNYFDKQQCFACLNCIHVEANNLPFSGQPSPNVWTPNHRGNSSIHTSPASTATTPITPASDPRMSHGEIYTQFQKHPHS